MTGNLIERIDGFEMKTNPDTITYLKSIDLNVKNINNIYNNIVNVLETTNGSENPFIYSIMSIVTENITDMVSDHICNNFSDLIDPEIMDAYAKLLALTKSFDSKIINKNYTNFNVYKNKKGGNGTESNK